MDAFMQPAAKYNLFIIEDVAQAQWAIYLILYISLAFLLPFVLCLRSKIVILNEVSYNK